MTIFGAVVHLGAGFDKAGAGGPLLVILPALMGSRENQTTLTIDSGNSY
jgi:hypothetical protein